MWVEVCDFPEYSIDEDGNVRNERNGKILKWSYFSNGTPVVQLRRDGQFYLRQVCTLMANSWLEAPTDHRFNTPMQLDGNRTNCHRDNLVFRPRWFAIMYRKEMARDPYPAWTSDFLLIETDEVFNSLRECATKYGLLQKDIHFALFNGRRVFPHGYTFRWL